MTSRTVRRTTSLLVAALMACALLPGAALAEPPADGGGSGEAAQRPHCASLVSKPAADGTSTVAKTRCYRRLAGALRFAAKGAVIPDDVEPDQITDAMLLSTERIDPKKLTTVIGIHWEHADRGGRDRVYFVKGPSPCAHNRVWQIRKLDAGWDQIVSSAEGFGGCGTFIQFEHVRFDGASRRCTPYCATLGDLNDQVSSIRWRA